MGFGESRSGFSKQAENIVVREYVPTSPFQNGDVDLHLELIPSTLTETEDGMGYVESSSQDGERVTRHRVRVACLHWAPNHSINDCRFGCGRISR